MINIDITMVVTIDLTCTCIAHVTVNQCSHTCWVACEALAVVISGLASMLRGKK